LNVAWTRPSDLEPSFSTRVASSALAWLLPGRAALQRRVTPASFSESPLQRAALSRRLKADSEKS